MADCFRACTLRASVMHGDALDKLAFVCSVDDFAFNDWVNIFLFIPLRCYLLVLLSNKFELTAPA